MELTEHVRRPNPEAPATVFELAPEGKISSVNAAKGGSATMPVNNDLAELKGIGPKYAEMLKSIGVDSIKELSHRNASHLKEMIETRHGTVVGLSEHECQTWIDEAKAHDQA
jgi:predicted flap endonuclease-1-like 5' DNA nuclease